jgi:hypothetical protein
MSGFLAPALRLEASEMQRQMRVQDKARFTMPDMRGMPTDTSRAMQAWYVVMVWDATPAHWSLAGFYRRRHSRKPVSMNRLFASMRRKLGMAKDEKLKVVDLLTAHRHVRETGEIVHPNVPQHYTTLRPSLPPPEAVAVQLTTKDKITKVRDRTTPASLDTRYIAIGLAKITGSEHIYLGPLSAATMATARREADRTWGGLYGLTILNTKKMSAKYRRRVWNGNLIPGYTRLHPLIATGDV